MSAVARRARTVATACSLLLLAATVAGWAVGLRHADVCHIQKRIRAAGEINASVVGYASHVVICIRTDADSDRTTPLFVAFAHDPGWGDAFFDPEFDVGRWDDWTWPEWAGMGRNGPEWAGLDRGRNAWLGWHAEVSAGHPRGAHDVYLFVPDWFLAAVCGVLPARAWRRGPAERHRQRTAGRCRRCGYDLRATPGRCPECGTAAAVA